jgi:hypothetical protein
MQFSTTELRAEKAFKNLIQRGRPAEKLAAELRFHAANVDLCDNSFFDISINLKTQKNTIFNEKHKKTTK